MITAKDLLGWFEEPGAYVLVDGQFGSTGKGVAAALLAEVGRNRITHVTTNAGPNSGHTAYRQVKYMEDERVMTQQLPIASVFLERPPFYRGVTPPGSRETTQPPITLLNAGAVIDTAILYKEMITYNMSPSRVVVHPAAAVITDADREADAVTVRGISGTGKGIGPAIGRKIARQAPRDALGTYRPMLPAGRHPDLSFDRFWDWSQDAVFVESAQGFSLGLNSQFYPFVTSRECTAMQALSDARIPAQMLRKTIVCFRTFPIRVGSVGDGTSGGCYPDQQEISWADIGVEPELTTVTKRVRRVFTWSRLQFRDCIAANFPEVLFVNFLNYMANDRSTALLLDNILLDYREIMGKDPVILGGYTPRHEDVKRLF